MQSTIVSGKTNEMKNNKCKIVHIGPICYTNDISSTHLRNPEPALFSSIPLLWEMLDLVVQDWRREADPLQEQINIAKTEGEELYFVAHAFNDLPPYYLKCIFSYVFFFIALEETYNLFYSELNRLNRELVFRVAHDKKPKRNDYIEKVRLVRNISIAHIGSDEVSRINSRAGMMWLPLSLVKKSGEKSNLGNMAFCDWKLMSRNAAGNLIDRSTDLSIKGIPELHRYCTKYLEEYDNVCAKYLEAIIAKLPVTVGDGRYEAFRALGAVAASNPR